jgi:predicted DNA-binding transcriptional regulator AlpA
MIASSSPKKPNKTGHTQPKAPTISLDQPGRLRVAHVLSLLGISHSHFYAQMRMNRYPKPDGHDGTLPYWNTATMKAFLAK